MALLPNVSVKLALVNDRIVIKPAGKSGESRFSSASLLTDLPGGHREEECLQRYGEENMGLPCFVMSTLCSIILVHGDNIPILYNGWSR